MKHKIIPLALLIIIAILAVSCSEPEMQIDTDIVIEDEKPTQGGVINIGCIEPKSLNPLLVNSKSYTDVSKLLFNGLVEYDETLKPVLVLADSINMNDAGDKVIIKLKHNIRWSDGEYLTSDDVVYTLDTIKRAGVSIYKSKLENITSYKALDDYTIEMKFGGFPYNSLDALTFPIVARHSTGSMPVGTGPYKVVEYNRLKYMELEPNEYNIQSSMPYISKIRVNFIKDIDSFDSAFETGQIDMINTSSYDWEKYKESRDVNTYEYVSTDYEFISLNFNNPILSDKNVRRALMYGINRTSITEKHLLGNAVVTDTPIRHGSWLYSEDEDKYMYNKAEAQYSINNAGFALNEDTKIFEREVEGKKQQLRLRLITNSENDYRVKAAEDIKNNLEDIGFVIDVEIMNFENLMGRINKKDYDMALVGINFSPEIDLYNFFHSSQISRGMNYGGYVNPRMDLLLEQSKKTLSTENKYVNYQEIQRIIKDDLPIISLFYKKYALVMRNKVRGEIIADSENLFRTINHWYIPKS
ncbi:peptide ABC transporter substrate-binding protein [Lutispora thermophila]|uniref:Peptide/nickel transport system substrate-binding protein n=1 Tax=Lutispora thermophila DSM 19022 TaxID=1122184 RepID=A0A1M6FQX1_9FIRM|nr:peptide ABC transporter substrate-binding protein [Lutispora thermophila]SHJ00102.1 peptide/nickel transport system substrate-binding protein [Lutispora thermophila DSM 19022]